VSARGNSGRRSSSRSALRSRKGARVIAVECYPGVFEDAVAEALSQGLRPALVLRTNDCWKRSADIDAMIARDLTDDPVFGRMNGFTIDDFADHQLVEQARTALAGAQGLVLILGTGTRLIAPCARSADLRRHGALGNPDAHARGQGRKPRRKQSE
jgi:hypothetical protein